MGMLEDWYGPERAAQLRREQARRKRKSEFAAAPDTTTVRELSDAQKTLLRARMEMVLAALEQARQRGLDLVRTVSALNYVPGLNTIVGFFTTSSEGRAAIRAYLANTVPTQLANARATMEEVLAGTYSVERWFAARKTNLEGMVEMLKALGDNTTGRNMLQTWSDVWDDVANRISWIAQTSAKAGRAAAEVVDSAVGFTASYPKLVLMALLALGGFVLYRYATAPLRLLPRETPKLSQYRRRWRT